MALIKAGLIVSERHNLRDECLVKLGCPIGAITILGSQVP